MIKVTLYLQNGKTVPVYLRKRQYNYLTQTLWGDTDWERVKKWFKRKFKKRRGKEECHT